MVLRRCESQQRRCGDRSLGMQRQLSTGDGEMGVCCIGQDQCVLDVRPRRALQYSYWCIGTACILVAIIAFVPVRQEGECCGSIALTGTTDNQGNSHIVSRLMSSSFPLNVMLMELVEQLHVRKAWLDLSWVPRQQNEEADALSNGEFSAFDPLRRVSFDPEHQDWSVMTELLTAGGSMFQELEDERQKKAEDRKMTKKRKRAREEKLRVRHPW